MDVWNKPLTAERMYSDSLSDSDKTQYNMTHPEPFCAIHILRILVSGIKRKNFDSYRLGFRL